MLAPRQPMLTSLTPPPAGSINQACVQIREDLVDSRRLYGLAVFILISGDHANPLADQTGIIYSLATPGDRLFLPESPCFSFFLPYVFLFFPYFFFSLEIVAPHWLLWPIGGVLRGPFGGKTADAYVSTPVCVYILYIYIIIVVSIHFVSSCLEH